MDSCSITHADLDKRALEYPLEYYWIMLKTKLGRNCTYLETFFENAKTSLGTYEGTGAVVGQPGKSLRDQPAFLRKLQKHKGKRQPVSLTISASSYHYRTKSGLRVLISRGNKGWVFDGNQKIGLAEGPNTAWISLGPIYPEWQRLEERPRIVNWF